MKIPVYHRQRFLLLLLEAAGGRLGRMDLQKLLFLHETEQKPGYFAFVPYHYGAYSFQCADDMDLLSKRGWLKMGDQEIELLHPLPNGSAQTGQKRQLRHWLMGHSERGDSLVRKTYLEYPFFAQNSRMKERLLSNQELQRVHAAAEKQPSRRALIQTIGYEGIPFETYVNRLIQNGTTTLCDVRRNPHSRKFGFSQATLSRILPRVGIAYFHEPRLGIESDKRRKLESREDYEKLFAEYRETLPEQRDALEVVCDLVARNQATALTCFEADPVFCHRFSLSKWLENEKSFKVEHL